ncbi:MAG: hypothetical protein NC489_46480, partial [Ruminococcus flavefaciens]|nr:hypothetical protein [Ruminococcus flavefaciens]
MKNRVFILFLFLSVLLLAGCGREETKELYDIMVEKQDFPDFEETLNPEEPQLFRYMGTQFWREEPIQLWGSMSTANIYLLRPNGEIELLAERFSGGSLLRSIYDWYLDEEGCFYCNMHGTIRKLDGQGEKLYDIYPAQTLPGNVSNFCQTPDGRMYLALSLVNDRSGLTFAELNPADGSVTVLEDVETDPKNFSGGSYLGAGTTGPAVMGAFNIMELDRETEKLTEVLSFSGTSYTVAGSGGQQWYK